MMLPSSHVSSHHPTNESPQQGHLCRVFTCIGRYSDEASSCRKDKKDMQILVRANQVSSFTLQTKSLRFFALLACSQSTPRVRTACKEFGPQPMICYDLSRVRALSFHVYLGSVANVVLMRKCAAFTWTNTSPVEERWRTKMTPTTALVGGEMAMSANTDVTMDCDAAVFVPCTISISLHTSSTQFMTGWPV